MGGISESDIAREVAALDQQRRAGILSLQQTPKQELTYGDVGLPFEQITVDLSATATSSGFVVDRPGVALNYRRENSNPAGRLTIDMGGTLIDFYPGQRLEMPFNRFGVALASRSPAKGVAQLVLEKKEGYRWQEPHLLYSPGEDFQPFDLLGTLVGSTFASVPINTQPAGVVTTLAFQVTGLEKVALYLDMNPDAAGGNFGSVDFEPWFLDDKTQRWWSQPSETFTVPDANSTSRFRVYLLDVNGTGFVYLNPINSEAAKSTHVGIIARAIR